MLTMNMLYSKTWNHHINQQPSAYENFIFKNMESSHQPALTNTNSTQAFLQILIMCKHTLLRPILEYGSKALRMFKMDILQT